MNTRKDSTTSPVVTWQWNFSIDGETVEARPHVRVRANNASSAVAAAVEGLGITRLPTYQMANHLGELLPILCNCDSMRIPMHLVYAALARRLPMISEECAESREAVSQIR